MAIKPATASEAVAKSNAKRGAVPVGLRLLPDEMEILDKMADRFGGRKAAFIAGLRALEARNEPSNADLLEMLKARLNPDTHSA